MSAILTEIGLVVTAAAGWASDVGTTIVGTPILMVGCCVPLVGLGIGLFKRLFNVGH